MRAWTGVPGPGSGRTRRKSLCGHVCEGLYGPAKGCAQWRRLAGCRRGGETAARATQRASASARGFISLFCGAPHPGLSPSSPTSVPKLKKLSPFAHFCCLPFNASPPDVRRRLVQARCASRWAEPRRSRTSPRTCASAVASASRSARSMQVLYILLILHNYLLLCSSTLSRLPLG